MRPIAAVVLMFALVLPGCGKNEETLKIAKEVSAKASLMLLRSSTMQYKMRYAQYPAALGDLKDFITDPALLSGAKNGFNFKFAKNENSWECYAVPADANAGGFSFYMSDDGVLREKEGIQETGGKDWPEFK